MGRTDLVYNCSKFLYPPKIEMTPYDCERWIISAIQNFKTNEKLSNYVVDRVIYWKLIKSRCVTVKRDTNWFSEKLPIITKIWGYINFLRKNEQQKKIFIDYVNAME